MKNNLYLNLHSALRDLENLIENKSYVQRLIKELSAYKHDSDRVFAHVEEMLLDLNEDVRLYKELRDLNE